MDESVDSGKDPPNAVEPGWWVWSDRDGVHPGVGSCDQNRILHAQAGHDGHNRVKIPGAKARRQIVRSLTAAAI